MTDRIVDRSSERPRAEICGGALCRKQTQQKQWWSTEPTQEEEKPVTAEWCPYLEIGMVQKQFQTNIQMLFFSFTPKHIQGIVTLWRWFYFRGLNQSKSPRVQLVFLWTHNMQLKELWIQELYETYTFFYILTKKIVPWWLQTPFSW